MYDYTYISIICSIFLGVAITCQFFWTPAASATSETPRCVETKPWNTATRLPRIHLGRWWFFGDLMVCQWGNHIHILYNIYIWIIINPFCGNKIGYIMIYIYIWYTLKYSNRLYIAWCLGVSKNWDILPSSTPTLPSWEGKSSNAKKGALSILRHIQHYGWLVVWNINFMIFHNSWEFHHPNWRTPSFFRGVGWNHQPDGEMAIFPGISRWWFDCFPTSWWIGIP